MQVRLALIFFLWFSSLYVFAQGDMTTFILVRHGEKILDGTKDPDLSEAGKIRSERLKEILQKQPISAIYSTNFRRTLTTANPLALSKALSVQLYEAFHAETLYSMLERHRRSTILLVGHSNNIPWIANELLGEKKFSDFADDDYSTILIVTVPLEGQRASVIRLTY